MKSLLLFTTTTLFSLLTTLTLAAPEAIPTDNKDHKHHGCLSDGTAHKIVQRWISLHEGKIDLLDQTVTHDVTAEDDQVNFLFSLPPGPYAVGKEALRSTLEFSQASPGSKNLKFKKLLIVHDCDTISFRWQATSEATGLDPNSTAKAGDPITYKGIDILEIAKGTKLIKKAITSADYLWLIYYSGIKICFQKGAVGAVCSA